MSRITYIHEPSQNGENKDILSSTKKTIGQFVGDTSRKSGTKNFLDNDGNVDIKLKGINVADGSLPAPLIKFDGSHVAGAFSAFEQIGKTEQGQRLIAIQNSISNYGELNNIHLIKGKEIAVFDGSMTFEQLIFDAQTPNGKIATAVSENLLRENGYDGTRTISQNPNDPVPVQDVIGQHKKPGERYEVAIKDYKNLGIQLLLQGSGELTKINDLSSDTERAAFIAASPLAFARLGAKVPYSEIKTQNVLKQQDPTYVQQNKDEFYGNPRFVNGSPNNPLIMFDGFSNFAQTTTCYLLFTALFTTIITVAATYEAVSDRRETRGRGKTIGSTLNGTTRLFGMQAGNNFFGLHQTENDYTTCVRRGLRAFFGFGADGSLANSTMFVQNPGYSGTILRMLVSDTLDIFGNSVLGSLIPGGIPANNVRPTSVIEGIEQGSQTLARLQRSKLLKFMNIVANMGDIILNLEAANIDSNLDTDDAIEQVNLFTTQTIAESENENVNKLRNLQKRSRLNNDYGKRLAWGGDTTPNLLMYTSTFESARSKFVNNRDANVSALYDSMMYKHGVSSEGKIDKEIVEKIEKELGYSYLPFYIQDLRTNEILSFHGLIENINDSFSTDYESSESYGRMGVIPSFKNVKRKTGISFYMIAANKNDFDLMWYKLNRLIAMSLPMYTQGRQLNQNDGNSPSRTNYKFIQPFSQVPGATPLVRIRVGDLITSNRSELDIARLYGAGNPQAFQISRQTVNDAFETERAEAAREAELRRTSIQDRNIDRFQPGKEYFLPGTLYVVQRSQANTSLPRQELVESRPGGNGRRVQTLTNIPIITEAQTVTVNGEAYYIAIVGGQRYTMSSRITPMLRLTENDAALALNQELAAQQTTVEEIRNRNSTTDFINGEESMSWLKQTPVFKAFESSPGEGMLAAIESVSPEFEETFGNWEDEQGSVAPKLFKIHLGLIPIFDINPGLTADGTMIGMPYRVGRINHAAKGLNYRGLKTELNSIQADGTPQSSDTPTTGENSELAT